MQKSSLKPYAPWALALGVSGLIVAAAAALIYREFNTVVQVSLVVGLLGLALAVFFNPGALMAWAGARQARYGTNAIIMSMAMLGIVVLVNYIVDRLPASARFYDWSEGQVNTLAPESLEAIQKLPQPVKAIGFYSTDSGQRPSAQELLDRFREVAPDKFDYEFFDPINEPLKVREYNVTRDATLILTMGDLREEIGFASESEIASALVRFTQPAKRTVYFLTGHGERSLEGTDTENLSGVADLLTKQNYDLQPLDLQITATVPADARAVVIAGPVNPLNESETQALAQYLQTPNAALVALLDPPVETQGLEIKADPFANYLASTWSVTARADIVIDPQRSINGQPLVPATASYGSSPIVDRLKDFITFFPIARSLEYTSTNSALTIVPLIQTSDSAWGETNLDSLNTGTSAPDSADAVGTLTLAVSVANSTTNARLVIFGDSAFVSNGYTEQSANANLFVNSLNWVTLDESLINLTPRTPTQRTLQLTDTLTANVIFFVTVVLMPLAVLVAGGVVWFLRRRHV